MAQESSPSRVGGLSYRVFEHDGKKYLLSNPLKLLCFKEEEAFVLSRRRDPALFGLRVYQRLPPSSQVALWEGCALAEMAGVPSADEWNNYKASMWKPAYMFWHCLDAKHKKDAATGEPMDLLQGMDWAVEFVNSLSEQEFAKLAILLKIVGQDEAIKNSSGRTASAAPAHPQPPESHDTTDGLPSTSISQTGTDTAPSR